MQVERLLYRDADERDRMLDMWARLQSSILLGFAVLGFPLAVGIPRYGWGTGLPLLAAAAFFALSEVAQARRRFGPVVGFVQFCVAQGLVLTSFALAGGPVVYLLTVPIFPMLLAATGWRRESAAVAAVASIAGLVSVALLTAPEQIAEIPPALWVPVLLLLVITLSALAVRDADMVTRDDAVVDELTGLLNRVALQGRVAELTHQGRATNERVSVIVADVDRFKEVNDTLGHAAGDRVLAGCARRLAAAAGGAPVYRFGGEEFVLLLPGYDERAACELAERLRAAVADGPIEGAPVTASFGVAVPTPDDGFDYARLFAEADAAMYAAKAAGRDRVMVAGATAPAAAAGRGRAAGGQATAPAGADGAARPRSPEATWLVRDAVQRAHLVDIVHRTTAFTKITSALVTVAIVSMTPWVGWHMLVPVVLAGLAVELGTRAALGHRRPEYLFVGSLVFMQVGAAAAVIIAGPEILFALPIFAIAMFGSAASLPGRGAAVLVATGTVTMTAATLAVGAGEVWANPVILALPLALTASLAIIGSAMGARVTELRVAAISDALTGALNRVGLEARIAELSQQAGAEPVALVVADLDHFKAVNDARGHEAGDRVLAEVAARMRRELRAFDAMYRIGGEEFVIVLPGAGADTAAAVAERIRAAVARMPAAGAAMTVSLGVAASSAGAPFDYDATFAAADMALLQAKRDGRDRVLVAGAHAGAAPPPVAEPC